MANVVNWVGVLWRAMSCPLLIGIIAFTYIMICHMSYELANYFLFLLPNDMLGAIGHSTDFLICPMSWPINSVFATGMQWAIKDTTEIVLYKRQMCSQNFVTFERA